MFQPLRQTLRSRVFAALLAGMAIVSGVVVLQPSTVCAADWQKFTLHELTIESPAAFKPGQDILSQLPAEVQKVFANYEMVQTDGEDFIILIARMELKEGTPPNLQGATDGAMTDGAKRLGDPDPKYKVTQLKVSDNKARRGTYAKTMKGVSWHSEGLFILRGQKLWQVQVIYSGDDRIADADRAIKSVKVAPEK